MCISFQRLNIFPPNWQFVGGYVENYETYPEACTLSSDPPNFNGCNLERFSGHAAGMAITWMEFSCYGDTILLTPKNNEWLVVRYL
jgi:hypothetical protein